jgi:hypothetical protein
MRPHSLTATPNSFVQARISPLRRRLAALLMSRRGGYQTGGQPSNEIVI